MALDPVPWLIGGGALHSPDVARAFASVAMGGKGGVIGVGAGKVLAAGGGDVTIGAGAFAIENTYPGGADQMYVGREISASLVAIPATAATPRSDMLVVVIDDPQFGGPAPVDPAVGPYISYDIISNVGSTATTVPGSYGKPALALARIDLPASTSTITQAMIADLRGVQGVAGTAKYKKVVRSLNPVASNPQSAAPPGEEWPTAVGWDVEIPYWATKMSVRATLGGINRDSSSNHTYGKLWIQVGAVGPGITSETTKYDIPNDSAGKTRVNLLAGFADTIIPEALRGTVQNVNIWAQNEGSGTDMDANDKSTIFLDVEFFEEPV